MCLKRLEKKNFLGLHNKEIPLNTFLKKCRISHQMQKQVFYKKTIVKKLAIFTEKHLCWSIAKSLRAAILKNICERQKPYDETEKNKTCSQGILTLY